MAFELYLDTQRHILTYFVVDDIIVFLHDCP